MAKSRDAYTPKFPQAHAFLLDVYQNAMKPGAEDSATWCERFKATIRSWEALKKDGVLPELFTKGFWEDVRDVALKVNGGLDLSKLTTQQQELTFGMGTLQHTFGAK